jgi:hypothetical protein
MTMKVKAVRTAGMAGANNAATEDIQLQTDCQP